MAKFLAAILAGLVLSLGGCDNDIDISTCEQFCQTKNGLLLRSGPRDMAKECTCVFDKPKSHVHLDLDQPAPAK